MSQLLRVLCFAAFIFFPVSALAQPMLIDTLGGVAGYGTECLSPNDDGSSTAIDLTSAFPGGLDFFGIRHRSAYVNTNGNITFSGPLRTYTPNAFPVADQPMIAPYWADVDIRGTACTGSGGSDGCRNPSDNGVWWHLEPGRMVVTWDRVGYFSCATDLRMTFQLILTEARYCGVPGDFDVEFRYTQCGWETGNASGGTSGFGGTQAQVGFDAGNTMDYVSIPGSRMAGISMRVCNESNVGVPGVWRFRIRAGAVECPDAGEVCDTGMPGVCGEGRTQCVADGTVCQDIISPSEERCDALDNDCDGTVDEGDGLCGMFNICERGTCIEPCFEGGCGEGEICREDGICVEEACVGVMCPDGQRCRAGVCSDVCSGVVCPDGQTCRAGRCLDLCADIECDACTACDDGACIDHCSVVGCPPGQECEEDGLCVDADCYGVRCGPGRVCRMGTCVDACVGVVCPDGEACFRGECVDASGVMPDAGPTPPRDAGTMSDAGADSDAGDMPVTMDGGMPVENDASTGGGTGGGSSEGCGCRVPAARSSSRHAEFGLSLLVLVALVLRRRRR